MESGNVGECGFCGLVGPLQQISDHVMSDHVEVEEHATGAEAESFTNNTENEDPEDVNCIRWPSQHVVLLIRLVESYQNQFETSLKKHIWTKISAEISKITGKNYSAEQVDNKYKGLKKTYKKIKDHNNSTGTNTKSWQFFNAMDNLLGKKPEVIPPATCSSSKGLKVNSEVAPAELHSDNGKISSMMKKRKKAVCTAERRHQEKMKRFDQLIKLCKVSVEHQTGKKLDLDNINSNM